MTDEEVIWMQKKLEENAALRKRNSELAQAMFDLLDPEMYGWAVSAEARNYISKVLNITGKETA